MDGKISMTHGQVVSIYIAHNRGEQTISVDLAHAIPGMGIEGDRYFMKHGVHDTNAILGREITLIEIEAIVSMQNEDGIQISPDQTRRNIVTRGITLNDLVGRIFYVGNIQLRGIRLCEPCQSLANRTDPRILNSMAHRGSLRAEILTEGIIHINDSIETSN